QSSLLVNRQLRVTDDVREQDMRDLKMDLFLNFGRHARKLFRRKRGDDFLEARIAAQRIPGRVQFQLAVAKLAAREPGRDRQLLASEVFLTDPGSDDCEELNHPSAIDGIFCHGQKLNRPVTLAQGILFSPKSSVDHAKHAESGAVIGLCLHNLLLSSPGFCKSGVRRSRVTFHASKQAFIEGSAKLNGIRSGSFVTKDCEGASGSDGVVLAESQIKPGWGDALRGSRIILEHRFN